jgi:ribosomal protein S13
MAFPLIALLVLPVMPSAWASADASLQEIFIRVEGSLVTMKAKEVTHRQILEGLAKSLGFELIIAGSLEEPRSLELQGKPWEEALKRAISPASWAFVYEPSASGFHLAKVLVFPARQENASPASLPPSPAPARITPPPSQVPDRLTTGRQTSVSVDQQELVESLLAELLKANDEETRAIALFGLAGIGGERAMAALAQALQDQDAWMREMAVEALAEIGGEQAMQRLQQALQDKDAEVRQSAQEALERLTQGSQ